MEVQTNIENCIFCNASLDNSDEHIIPNCLNGRLRSTKIICHNCNTSKFGAVLDPIVKKLFNTTLLVLGFENANSVHSEDPEGKKYLYTKEGKLSPIRPELTEIKKDGKTYISVNGDDKNAIKYFAKQATEFIKKGYKPIKFDLKKINESAPPLRIENKFEISPEIILELNKIAIEFYAYSGLDSSYVKHISERVNILDRELDNVVFCNWESEVRIIKPKEISHLIVLRTNKNGTLYCYIELFNIICAYIKLFDNSPMEINYLYHQDAITGERFTENILLNLDSEPPNKNATENFDLLINSLFDRDRNRMFSKVSNEIFKDILDKTEKEVESGELIKEKLQETYFERCSQAIAHLSIHDFPYMIDDFKDEENPEFNYIHSNLQEGQFEKFCELNNSLIGIKVAFHDDGEYIFESFLKRPFVERNGIRLVNVVCVLTHSETKRRKYIPYRKFFEGLIPN